MLSRLAAKLAHHSLTTNYATYGTVPDGHKWEVTEILVTNTAAAAHTISLQSIHAGDAAGLAVVTITGPGYLRLECFTTLLEGDVIQAKGASSADSIIVSGIDVFPV